MCLRGNNLQLNQRAAPPREGLSYEQLSYLENVGWTFSLVLFVFFMHCHTLCIFTMSCSKTNLNLLYYASSVPCNSHPCFDRTILFTHLFIYKYVLWHSYIRATDVTYTFAYSENKPFWSETLLFACSLTCICDKGCNKSAVGVFGANSGDVRCNHRLVQLALV